jgi:hypothetical protein
MGNCHFDQSKIIDMIFIDDFFTPRDWIDLWIFSEELTLTEAQDEMKKACIDFRQEPVPALSGNTYLISHADVYLQFAQEQDEEETLLTSVSQSIHR